MNRAKSVKKGTRNIKGKLSSEKRKPSKNVIKPNQKKKENSKEVKDSQNKKCSNKNNNGFETSQKKQDCENYGRGSICC